MSDGVIGYDIKQCPGNAAVLCHVDIVLGRHVLGDPA